MVTQLWRADCGFTPTQPCSRGYALARMPSTFSPKGNCFHPSPRSSQAPPFPLFGYSLYWETFSSHSLPSTFLLKSHPFFIIQVEFHFPWSHCQMPHWEVLSFSCVHFTWFLYCSILKFWCRTNQVWLTISKYNLLLSLISFYPLFLYLIEALARPSYAHCFWRRKKKSWRINKEVNFWLLSFKSLAHSPRREQKLIMNRGHRFGKTVEEWRSEISGWLSILPINSNLYQVG